MEPYKRHIIVCVGEKCAPAGPGEEIYQRLKMEIAARGLGTSDGRVLRSKTPCLNVCEDGPLMVVYPEGVWYDHLTVEKALRILEEHVLGGNPVREWVYARMGGDRPAN